MNDSSLDFRSSRWRESFPFPCQKWEDFHTCGFLSRIFAIWTWIRDIIININININNPTDEHGCVCVCVCVCNSKMLVMSAHISGEIFQWGDSEEYVLFEPRRGHAMPLSTRAISHSIKTNLTLAPPHWPGICWQKTPLLPNLKQELCWKYSLLRAGVNNDETRVFICCDLVEWSARWLPFERRLSSPEDQSTPVSG